MTEKHNPTTFDDDLLGRKEFAERVEKYINNEKGGAHILGSYVLSLNSKFGSGKTTFLEMWKNDREERRKNPKKKMPIDIWLNAWQSDYFEDPLAAIIFALYDEIIKGTDCEQDYKGAAKRLIFETTSQFIKNKTGFNIKALKEAVIENSNDIFEAHDKRKDALKDLKKVIQKYKKEKGTEIWIVIDELDRCRPDYAISYLETIKHIFDIPGLVFVLAVDRSQLENSAKHAFGTNLDFSEYYRKFVHREVDLPEITTDHYKELIKKCSTNYMEKLTNKVNFSKNSTIYEFIEALNLTSRQLMECIRNISYVNKSDNTSGFYIIGLAFMVSLKVAKPNIYNQIKKGKFSAKNTLQFMDTIFANKKHLINSAFNYFIDLGIVIDPPTLTKNKDGESIYIVERREILSTGPRSYYPNVGMSPAKRIYQDIEGLSQWYPQN